MTGFARAAAALGAMIVSSIAAPTSADATEGIESGPDPSGSVMAPASRRWFEGDEAVEHVRFVDDARLDLTFDPVPGQDQWRIDLTPVLWAPEVDGTATVRGVDADIDMSFSDILDDLDFGAMLQVRAFKDPWVVQFNGFYLKLETDGEIGPASIDAEVRFGFAMLAAGRRIATIPVGTAAGADAPLGTFQSELSVTPYVGLRYTYARTRFSADVSIGPISGSRRIRDTDDWVDALVGVNTTWRATERVMLGLGLDIGGFGIGSSSNLTWSLAARVTYSLQPNFHLIGGYHLLDYDRTSGDSSGVGFDGQLRGPFAGVVIQF
ncbi:MAG: hypothetical protein ACYTGG_13130 [Planctomycetota bacterium]|jgi:hypothetical protein